jgi:hypothetical protein
MTVANFIIAGTEKAGTTSVYTYLSQHPDVCASRRKETDYFRCDTFRDGAAGGVEEYSRFFPARTSARIVMEASPGYLGEADIVAPRIRELVPDVRLLFILREPIDRLYSSYRFHRGRLNLPESLTFHGYLQACMAHADHVGVCGRESPTATAHEIGEWYLNVLPYGRYVRYLRPYFDAFPRYNIKVAFYDDLCRDPRGFMAELSGFLEIDESFWSGVNLAPRNVTFFSRNRQLHRLAILANDRLEPILRPRPRLKSAVLRFYKQLNAAPAGNDGISDEDRELLEWYYAPWNLDLETLLGVALPSGWSTGVAEAERLRQGERARAWLP